MGKKASVSQEDRDAFHKAMEGTKPLKQKKVRITPPDPDKKVIIRPRRPELEPLEFKETLDLDPVTGEESIEFKHSSISNKILRNLRKGQYNVEAILDLHGMTVEKARTSVDCFLKQCLNKEIRVVLIIHGKGRHNKMPILKNKLNYWLRETNAVLAFCSAAQSHGSRGAIYVLLKHERGE